MSTSTSRHFLMIIFEIFHVKGHRQREANKVKIDKKIKRKLKVLFIQLIMMKG